jgi:predicted nucleic acid-binding protein
VIVLDASALVELLLDTVAGRRVSILLADPALAVHVPHLIDVETISVLRRFVRERIIDEDEAGSAIEDLLALDLQRHSHEGLLERAWALRNNVTAYDAMYLSLTVALNATLVTCDGRLSKAAAGKIRVQLVK